MKKKKLTKLALLGISFGLLAGGCSKADSEEQLSGDAKSFYEHLDPDAKKKFLELDSKHRNAAMDVIQSHGCGVQAACHGVREKSVEEQYTKQQSGK